MPAEIWTVLVALIALTGVYLTNFIGVDFRRFRDGSTLAAALAGELSSHANAIPELRLLLNALMASIEAGNKITFRPIEMPTDPIFLEGIPRFGLLGHKLVEDVVYTYQQIRVFRLSFKVLQDSYTDMAHEEIINRLKSCVATIERAQERGITLLPALKARADQPFTITWPWEFAKRMSNILSHSF